MISNKKSYAMKMLQLALALSLLHVNPDDYLQQRLRNWDSQLELRDGDGWELEMLRAVPMVEYPYANRKSMMPLIEDLMLYDHSLANTQYNVTAYLLNVSNESANQTAAMQEMQAIPPPSSATTTGGSSSNSPTSSSSPSSGGSLTLENVRNGTTATVSSIVHAAGSSNSSNLHNLPTPEIELFLNSESMQDQRSVWEQNLADLNDFNDLPIMNSHYGNLPLKDGQQQDPSGHFDLPHLDVFLPTFGSSANALNSEAEGAVALNGSFPNPDDAVGIKLEQLDDEDDKALLVGVMDTRAATCSTLSPDPTDIAVDACIKKEEPEEEVVGQTVKEEEVDLSPFIANMELTKEESEIVEVLWKQDVDLGFSLTEAQLAELAGSSSATENAVNSEDEIEKLKALEALKLDNPKYDSKDVDDEDSNQLASNEWTGIPFTIDNETGEYIRLPLDDILNDVIQFAELAGGENDEDDTTGASTSKAAAAAANKKILKTDNEDTDNNDDNDPTDNHSAKKNPSLDKTLKSEGGDYIPDDLENLHTEKQLSKGNKSSDTTKGDANEEDNDDTNNDHDDNDLPQSEIEVSSILSPLFDLDDEAKEELADLSMMLHSSAPFAPHHHHPHHPHHRGAAGGVVGGAQNYGSVNSAFHRQPSSGGFHHGHHQGRMPLSRGVSMEQRLQDIASLFNPIPSMGVVGGVSEMSPYPHYPTHPYTYQSAPQHAQYPPPPPHPHHHHHAAAAAMLHPNASLGDLCSTQPHYGHNLGSAVSSSMHLTNSTHDSDVTGVGAGAVGGAYKMEHDMMYYSNASSDMNHTTDGFINSILNDEDLHLMDMNVNDSFCRMVDVNNSTSNNSSVLGLPTGTGHASGAASGGSTAGSTTSGISMSAASNVAASAGAPVMTNDLMNATGAATQTVAGGTDRLDASSDSAVSSMGSERVPSLSDGEWGEGSDSAQDYHQGKYGGPYDYSYNNSATNRLNDGSRQPPVAQKKHHMFGKRFMNEQPAAANLGAAGSGANGPAAGSNNVGALVHGGPAHSIKYEYEAYPPVAGLHENMNGHGLDNGAMGGPALSKDHHGYGPGAYSLDFSVRTPRTPHELVQHNHTYTLPQGTGSLPRPQQRDKKLSTSSSTKSAKSSHNSSGSGGEEETYMTRDEKRARAMNIPIPVCDIINLPMDEFNERLSKYDLSENQLSLIRDIRRRGKNKVAAQNCRKRKLDQILSLEDEVKQVRRRKDELNAQRDRLFTERKRVSNKFSALHRHIFQYLRDPEGNPCSPSEYSLQQAADGSIYLLPRDAANKNDTNSAVGLLNGGAGIGSPLNGHSQSMPTAVGHHHSAHPAPGAGGGHNLHQAPHQQTVLHTAAGSLAHSHVQHHHQHHHHQQQHNQTSQPQTTTHAHGHHTTTHGGSQQQQPQKD
ncbi:segmentation protein cap'n'collar isoform X1 [Musca domestica]|uniref:Segmentation protein cap'n'collar isoform X1 n=3 Tax=Musca domestica TaxID=7370 RepID=A0ABM3VB19_MUSDO|nr:segmentation protein cap'n'collar isoform X1 [Musca domestica]XP_058982997.1 segmentation protein cap'n'collar isoform X1 [Musca domestica]